MDQSHLPFVPLQAPHVDFLLARRAAAGLCDSLPNPLRRSAASVPAGCQFFVSAWASDFGIPPGDALVSGVTRIGDRLTLGPAQVRATLLPSDLIGPCLVFERTHSGIDIRSDFLGMVPLFYAQFGEMFLCSNRVHLIALAAKAGGHSLTLDYNYVASGIFVDSIWCTQIGTQHLPFEGVRMVRPGEIVRFKDRKARVVPALPIRRHVIEPDEYQNLIKLGAQEIASNVAAAIDAVGPAPLNADLTGGRDSRIVLAAIVALERTKEVRFYTSDVGDAADVDVASGLAHHFGAAFSTGGGLQELEPMPPDDVLHLHRSVFFGLYHDMLLPTSRLVTGGPNFIGVGGGCGELYRDFWQKIMGGDFDFSRTSGIGRVVTRYLTRYGRWENFPPELKEQAPSLLAKTIKGLDGRTFGEKLDLHYLSFRNRLHFGLAGITGSILGKTTFFPLASPSLLSAARGLPPAEKGIGRVIFDVTRELCPIMSYLPYSHDPWPDMTQSRYHRPSKYDGATLTLKPGRDAWEAARTERSRASPARVAATPRHQILDRIMEVMPEMLRFVKAEAPDAAALIPGDILIKMEWLRARESKFQRFWYSRISAMADVLSMSLLALVASILHECSSISVTCFPRKFCQEHLVPRIKEQSPSRALDVVYSRRIQCLHKLIVDNVHVSAS